MISTENIGGLIGCTVVDSDGDKIGTVGQVYVDPDTGRPNWVTVRTGLFGMKESFVPLDSAEQVGDDIRVPYSKDIVKDAPRIDHEGALEEDETDNLYSYYEGSGGYSTLRPPRRGRHTRHGGLHRRRDRPRGDRRDHRHARDDRLGRRQRCGRLDGHRRGRHRSPHRGLRHLRPHDR